MTEELPHVRCLGCGYPISWKWNTYQKLLEKGMKPGEALDKIGFQRYCCRMWMQSPFKTPIRNERQTDPLDTGLEEQRTTLNVVGTRQPAMAPLQAMEAPPTEPFEFPEILQQTQAQPTRSYTVVPLTQPAGMPGIFIPDIPEVELPAAQKKGAERIVSRKYEAW